MKYLITESKLEDTILNYINKLFDVNDINWTHPTEWDGETNETWDDTNRIEFYIGDYQGEGEGCFYWYDCEYFDPNSPASEICPTVSVEYEFENQLNGYFGNMWHGPFKKWFTENFNLPVKTVDN